MSMRGGILIDRKGRVWPDDSGDLARRIGCRSARDDVATFAVRERGFVHLRPREDGMHVALRERRFNLTAFAGLMLELGRSKPPRVLLRVLTDDAPKFQLFTDMHDLCAHLERLTQGQPLEVRVARLAERRNLRVLTLPTFAPARAIVDLWERARGELTDEVHHALHAGGLLPRTIIVRQSSHGSRLVTEHFGSGIMILKPCEALLAVGRDLQDQPDKDYGAWIAEAYAETLWRRRVRVESCRALVRTSAATTLRTRYDRVIMPWHAQRDLFVMCLSIQREIPVALC
jgi:hypothetical protein